MGRSRYKFHEEYYPYFITSTTRDALPLLSIPEVATVILDSLSFLQNEREVTLFGYVLMENHFHAVVQGKDLSEKLRLAKSFMGRQIADRLRQDGHRRWLIQIESRKLTHKKKSDFQIWEEGFHPQQLTADEMVTQKLEYIHLNPVMRGFVDRAEHWRYSSTRNYLGMDGLIPVTVYNGRNSTG